MAAGFESALSSPSPCLDQHYLDASLYMLFTIVQLFVDTVVGCAVTRMQANPMVCGS